jgi:hypothetical protein
MHRTITRRTRTLTVGLLVAAALPASAAAQDLRTPDSRDAGAATVVDLRTPDSRDAAAPTIVDLRTPDSRDAAAPTIVDLRTPDSSEAGEARRGSLPIAVADDGFEWGIIGLGAAAVLLAGACAIVAGRRRTGVAH